jgi:hypothetical protein
MKKQSRIKIKAVLGTIKMGNLVMDRRINDGNL